MIKFNVSSAKKNIARHKLFNIALIILLTASFVGIYDHGKRTHGIDYFKELRTYQNKQGYGGVKVSICYSTVQGGWGEIINITVKRPSTPALGIKALRVQGQFWQNGRWNQAGNPTGYWPNNTLRISLRFPSNKGMRVNVRFDNDYLAMYSRFKTNNGHVYVNHDQIPYCYN